MHHFCFLYGLKEEEIKGRKGEEKKTCRKGRGAAIVKGRKCRPPWPTVSTAKRCPFLVKFQGNTLLNTNNIYTVSDFIFSGWIVRSNVFFFKKININLIVGS